MKTSLLQGVAAFFTAGFMGLTGCGPGEPGATEQELGTARAALSDGQVVRIVPAHSSKCFDVENGSTADGARIQQWDCWGAGQQSFLARWNSPDNSWRFIANHSGKCLDVREAGTANGTPLQQWSCGGGSNQYFRLEYVIGDEYRVRPVYINKCLDVSGYSVSNGAQVHLWDCNIGSNQLFRFVW